MQCKPKASGERKITFNTLDDIGYYSSNAHWLPLNLRYVGDILKAFIYRHTRRNPRRQYAYTSIASLVFAQRFA